MNNEAEHWRRMVYLYCVFIDGCVDKNLVNEWKPRLVDEINKIDSFNDAVRSKDSTSVCYQYAVMALLCPDAVSLAPVVGWSFLKHRHVSIFKCDAIAFVSYNSDPLRLADLRIDLVFILYRLQAALLTASTLCLNQAIGTGLLAW